MFWLVSGFVGLAIVFVKLGAYSVWLTVFKWISAILAIGVCLGAISAFFRYFFPGRMS